MTLSNPWPLLMFVLGIGCDDRPPIDLSPDPTSVAVPDDTASEASNGTGVNWTSSISELFQGRCVQCHRYGQVATFVPLDSYDAVVSKSTALYGKFYEPNGELRMPIFGGGTTADCKPDLPYSNDPALSEDEVNSLLDWLGRGAPLGMGSAPDAVQIPPAVTPLSSATDYPFDEGLPLEISLPPGDPGIGVFMLDRVRCVVVDPELTESGWMSGFGVETDLDYLFKGLELRLDRDRESLAFVSDEAPGTHGERWYSCDDGFGFMGSLLGSIQAGSGPSDAGDGTTAVPPFLLPPSSAVEIPAGGLLVYRVRYHLHLQSLDPDETGPPPSQLTYTDHTSLSVRWEDPSEVQAVAQLFNFGNTEQTAGSSNVLGTPPFEIPPPIDDALYALESELMLATVPGGPDDAYWVFSVEPLMRSHGLEATVEVNRGGTRECLGAIPSFQDSWQVPMRYDKKELAPVVYGGDALRGSCTYKNSGTSTLTLGTGPDQELCEFTVGLVPIAKPSYLSRSPPGLWH
jgi:hypothetical protein